MRYFAWISISNYRASWLAAILHMKTILIYSHYHEVCTWMKSAHELSLLTESGRLARAMHARHQPECIHTSKTDMNRIIAWDVQRSVHGYQSGIATRHQNSAEKACNTSSQPNSNSLTWIHGFQLADPICTSSLFLLVHLSSRIMPFGLANHVHYSKQ